ncbi:187-kDa microtubule-associated protein AIR9 isoform X2 [Phoenix dactylifera]|uniref:187-kDa microtubule-associated protein AIR9 isoform X2 n=1 Tax=Phoenix dactylifera TaxID=42345 RepID=A0A8B9AVN5_PHODC|nr:187-kDa microtubule-associated protein AIR9 isoform X2 [Phoenix dactylifera]
MEVLSENHSEDGAKKTQSLASSKQSPVASAESVKKSSKIVKPGGVMPVSKASGTVSSVRKKTEDVGAPDMSCSRSSFSFMKPTISSNAASLHRRNSTGGMAEKHPVSASKRQENGGASEGKKVSPSVSDPGKRSKTETRRSSLPSVSPKAPASVTCSETKKSPTISHLTSTMSDSGKANLTRKPSVRQLPSVTSSKRVPSSPVDSSNGRSSLRRAASNISSPSARSPSVSSSFKFGSMSSSVDRGPSLSRRRKPSTPESRDSRLIMLPQIDVKAGDELRLDLRGHRVRSLGALKLSPNLEFVYLRDNLLSSVEGIEILKRVKVLDLSFNDFKGPDFAPLGNCKALQQLYLAGNQITSLATLPQLPNLEFLSVAQNRLKSLCMASQPRLQVLAASKNKISTLKGFPDLPLLEHLRVEENPILEMPHLEAASILLVGPTLKKFNDRDLSPDELEIAKLYPAHTALCVRDGWEFCHSELAADSTFSFLVEQWKDHLPPGYMLKETFVEKPFEGDACHCHFNFVNLSNDSELVLKYQWFIGERTPTNFVPIADAVGEVYWPKHEDIDRHLKIECTPILKDIEYPPIFAITSPISPGTGYPKVLNLKLLGELVEGNSIKGFAEIAWCGGTPGKGVASWLRRRWNSSPVVIVGAEDEEYRLTVDDIDSSLVYMYTPVTEEGVKGEPQYVMTDFIKAAAPSVNNVRIIGDAVEGNKIKGAGEYFGGREGPSKFEWLRESKETSNFILLSRGTTEYTLTKEDVGRRITFVYIPVNLEGQEGASLSAMTEIVKQAPPKVTNLKIVGDMREGNKLTITATVTGGTEGSSRVQWFKTASSKVEGENGLEAVSTSKIAKAFRIPLGAVGCYIVAKFTPMAPDGETGEPAYVISEKVVETLPPSLNFLSVTGDFSEDEMLTASYGYIGGHEGKSLYNWFLHETETDIGALIPEVSGLLQYRITKDAIGKFISFKCTPVRDDGTVGEPRTFLGQERVRPGSPRLLSLQVTGKAVEGATLVSNKKYWGGEEGDSVFRWFLTSSDGTQKEIKGATTTSYTLTCDDIGFFVSVSCEPVRNDWARGPIVVSEYIGPILPGPPTCQSLKFLGSIIEGGRLSFIAEYTGGERGNCTHEWFRVKSNGTKDKLTGHEYLDLTLDDVGYCIELIYTPIRMDGSRGSPKSIISDVIVPADPRGIELILPSSCQDKEVVPLKSYYGGKEGNGKYIWYRTKEKLQESELVNLATASDDILVVGETLTYTPSLEDVGFYLSLYWEPTRADGKLGDPLVAPSNHPVMAALPFVSEVCIKELSSGVYAGEGKYYGGYEGSSLYSWYRETNEGTIVLLSGANSATYEVTDSDYNCRLLFGYTPVRSDAVVGELRLSEPSDIILPEVPKIEMLSLKGKEVEGEILTAVEVIPKSVIQQHIWDKYKKEIKYEWFCSVGMGDYQSFEPLPSHRSCSYKVRLEDIGRCMKCECTITDVFGRSSESVSAVTGPILPGIPKIDKLEIEGRGYHTNLYAVRGIYSGGKEGKSKIQWLRAMVGSPDLISIPGEVGRMYEANVDDVGYRLVAVYTPIREDGVEGRPVSASTDPISVEPDVYKEVKQKLDLGSVKFEALCDKDRSPKKALGVGNLERRVLEVNRKRVKVVKPGSKTSFPTTEIRGTYAPPFHVELYRNDQHRFKIVVDSDNEVDLMVQSRHMRDVIVLVIRGFAQRFNSTSLNSLLKIGT